MKLDPAQTLLNHIPGLQRPCELDLFVFFAKHPRTLMTSEQLARLLGYQLNEMARSLDVLLAAGLLTRTQNPLRAARMYVFAVDGATDGWPSELVQLASTREGRLALRRALTDAAAGPTDRLPAQGAANATA
jgi:hypothetical protein